MMGKRGISPRAAFMAQWSRSQKEYFLVVVFGIRLSVRYLFNLNGALTILST